MKIILNAAFLAFPDVSSRQGKYKEACFNRAKFGEHLTPQHLTWEGSCCSVEAFSGCGLDVAAPTASRRNSSLRCERGEIFGRKEFSPMRIWKPALHIA